MKHFSIYICSIILFFFPIDVRCQLAELDSILNQLEFKEDSVRTIFDFVASEIEYDTESSELLRPLWQPAQSPDEIVLEALKTKKGVCIDYAELFNALLKRAGYESYVVLGYSKDSSKIEDKFGHAWNAVRVKSKWYLYDPTWSSGHINEGTFEEDLNDTWYKISPEEFIITHIPFDPIWQLLDPPISHHQVKRNDFSPDLAVKYSFQDSIAMDLKRPTELAYASRIGRIQKAGITTRLVKRYVTALENTLVSLKVNSINTSFNDVVLEYNRYVAAKNKRFRNPKWTDNQLHEMIYLMKLQLKSLADQLTLIEAQRPETISYIAKLKQHIIDLDGAVNSEAEFVKKYLGTSKLVRALTF